MTPLDFWTTCSANNIVLDKPQVDTLERYHDELIYWNAKVNMISRRDEQNIWERHILHSLCILKYVQIRPKARVLDVGTGGGLPGIPIKVARPDVKMLLTDSIRKKASMAQMFAQHTGLKDFKAMPVRVEDLAQDPHYIGSFDVVVSRAVAKTAMLLQWIRPLLKPNAVCAFLKGGDLNEEIAEARTLMPDVQIQVIDIDMFGMPSFLEDQKKVVVCRFK
ncbi:MAG: 16S rRNA (guanine(527)-N(7))-methyltransferase RsmG [Candidatus Kapabacteria bacterium]|nr:16S rRNA (guanine(527)-N(7))-methyltransferase RsmG [Candidatus Kapabacteria bacterium]